MILLRIGAHMSMAGGFENAIAAGLEIDCEAVQMFVKSNRSWAIRAVKDSEFETFRKARAAQSGISCFFSHGTYLVNLAAEDKEILAKSITCFELEYDLSTRLGLNFLVFHPGAPKKMGIDKGIAQVATSLDAIAKKCPKSPAKILLENTAGQGSTIGRTWKELGQILDLLEEPKRFGICFDTCHAFAAGHDIRTEKAYEKTMTAIDTDIGLDRLHAFHLNDSEHELGTNHDRHAHVGEGHIGTDGFRWLISDPRFKDHPGIIETPESEKYPQDLTRLKGLRT